MYQQAPFPSVAQNKFRPWCGNAKYFRIRLDLRQTIEQCPLILREFKTVVSQKTHDKQESKKGSEKPSVLHVIE